MKFFFLILFMGTAAAQEMSFSRGPKNELIIKGKNCNELIKQHAAICSWRKSNEPDFIIPSLPKTCTSVGAFKSVTVSSCLPEFTKTYNDKSLVRSGANCWGTALSFKDISIKPRFVWQKEIEYWMDSPICRKLDIGEEKLPGDIINVFGPEYIFERNNVDKGTLFWEALYPNRLSEPGVNTGYSGFHNFLHSDTYISPVIKFGKESPSKDDRFKFGLMTEVYGRPREVDCQENQNLEPHNREYDNASRSIRGSKCAYFSIAYRCGSITKYFNQQTLNETELEIQKSIESLQRTQESLFKLQLSAKNSIPASEVKSLLKLSDDNFDEATEELKHSKSKNHEMLLVLKYFTAAGIRKTLEQAGLTPATEEL